MEISKICAVIPAYNASKSLKKVVEDLRQYIPHLSIIVVDDGSTDSTKYIARKLNVLCVEHNKNFGKGAALRSGFKTALSLEAHLIITIDADAQHNPKDIKKLLSKLKEEKLDLIIGSRMSNIVKMPFHRICSNKITSKLISWRLGQKIEDSQCGFRVIRADVLKKIDLKSNRFEIESELLIKSALQGFKIGSTTIETIYPKNRTSAMHLIADTLRFIGLYIRSFFW
ncbi:MAG: glycosyltransferase family 2 protein [bacterium]